MLDRHLAKDRFLLRQITHSEPRPLVHRIIGHVGSGKNDATAVWPNESDNHVEAGRLAGAIWSEQSNDLARARVDVHSIDDRPAAVNFHELVGGQDVVALRGVAQPSASSQSGAVWPIMVCADGLGEGEALSPVFFSPSSGVGSWRISVRLGPCVVNCPFWLTTITVSGLVAMWVFTPSCTRGVPLNSTSPVAAM